MDVPLRSKFNITLSLTELEALGGKSIIPILEIKDASQALRLLSSISRYSIATFLMMSILVGSFFKCFLYRYILVSSKLNNGSYFKMTSVNSLLLISAITHHFTHLYAGIFLAITIGTDIVLEDVLGTTFCHASQFIGNTFPISYYCEK